MILNNLTEWERMEDNGILQITYALNISTLLSGLLEAHQTGIIAERRTIPIITSIVEPANPLTIILVRIRVVAF